MSCPNMIKDFYEFMEAQQKYEAEYKKEKWGEETPAVHSEKWEGWLWLYLCAYLRKEHDE